MATEGESNGLHLADCPQAVQALARIVATEFQTAGTWPTMNDVHVMRVDQGIEDGEFTRYRSTLFNDTSDGGLIRMRLHLWILYDAGGFEQVFSDARKLVGDAFGEIRRTRKPAVITRDQIANQLGISLSDVRLTHFAYVFDRSYLGWQISSEESWKVVVDVSRLSSTLPPVETLFLQRPLVEQAHPGSLVTALGVWRAGGAGIQDRNPVSERVFIVHGSDAGPKSEVARTVELLGLQPIILHEQTNKGRTLVEKFEEYADVGFAIVILTPDDEGRRAGKGIRPRRRARQNVILELGFFWGKLGRERVCALVKGDVEKPSDYDGVVYVPYDDAGGWKLTLAKELKGCGYPVKMSKL